MENELNFYCNIKGIVHSLFTYLHVQTCLIYFLLWNIKDVLKNHRVFLIKISSFENNPFKM